MSEIWKDINGYEGLYQVSNIGNVRSLGKLRKIGRNERFISGRVMKIKKANYCHIQLVKNGLEYHALVHRLVASAFIENPLDKKTVNHKDLNKHNNHVDNLEWSTQGENNNHALRNGKLDTLMKGGTHYAARRVVDIITGKTYGTIKEAAIDTGVNIGTLNGYLQGKSPNKSSIRYV